MGLILCAACGEPDAAASALQRDDYESVPLCESCRAHFDAIGTQTDTAHPLSRGRFVTRMD